MADIEKVIARIKELAERHKNVELSEIEWIVNQLGVNGYAISERKNEHNTMFSVNGKRFNICHHNRGSKQVKPCYVREFLDRMCDLELYK